MTQIKRIYMCWAVDSDLKMQFYSNQREMKTYIRDLKYINVLLVCDYMFAFQMRWVSAEWMCRTQTV